MSVTEADSSVVSYDYDDIYQLTGEMISDNYSYHRLRNSFSVKSLFV
jgi:hypothetical protein